MFSFSNWFIELEFNKSIKNRYVRLIYKCDFYVAKAVHFNSATCYNWGITGSWTKRVY